MQNYVNIHVSDTGASCKQTGAHIFDRTPEPDGTQFKAVIECVVADFFNRARKNDFF